MAPAPFMADRIQRTPASRSDLINIWQFIADDNDSAADRVLDRIDQALKMLSRNPLAGRARPELSDDIRSFPVGNYIIFYRDTSEGILLVRVLSRYLDIQQDDVS